MNNLAYHHHALLPKTLPLITKREIDVLKLIAEGKSTHEIGQQLFISDETVKTHRKNLLRKLGASNGASLVKAAFCAGILLLN